MNIGIFDPYLDTMGGGEKYMLTASLCLSKKNNVTIFWNPSDKEKISTLAKSRFGFELENIQFTNNLFSKEVSYIKRILELRKYDYIFCLSDGSVPLFISKKLILHFQFPVTWVKPNLLTKIKFLFVKKVICNSNFTKGYVDRIFSINSKVVYPPPNDYKTKIIPKRNVILTVGRYNPLPQGGDFKKLKVLITVFKEMIDKGLKNWKLIVVVSFDRDVISDIEKLEEGIKKYPIEIEKNISNDELNNYYALAKIYWHGAGFGENLEVYPERAEHFGIATVEAMKNGAVPVVINLGGQPEIVTENKNGFLWNTKEELMNKTESLINNVSLINKISKDSRSIVNTFNTKRFCEEISSLF